MDYLEIRELYHHGIKGQKWGIRRFQNENGTLTSEGKNRYNKIQKESAKYEKKSKKQNAKIDNVWEQATRRGIISRSDISRFNYYSEKRKLYDDIAKSLKKQKLTDKTFDEIHITNKAKTGAKVTSGLLAGALGGSAISYKMNKDIPISSSTIESTLSNIAIGSIIGAGIGLIASSSNTESKSYEQYKNQK